MDTLSRSLQAGLKLLRTSPGVAVPAIAALAMGIGFTTTMFAIVHGATRPLPVSQPAEVVAVQKTAARGVVLDTSSYAFDLIAMASARSFEGIAGFQTASMNLAGDDEAPERISGAQLTANALSVMGLPPASGRAFVPEDARPGAEPVVILADRLWRRRFAADPAVVGRVIRIDGLPHTVIGVMPDGVGFPINAQMWTLLPSPPNDQPGAGPAMTLFGRLQDGVALDAARAELDTISRSLAGRFPSSHGAAGVEVIPFTEIETPRDVIRGLQFLVLAVSLVLLIACGNVASLLVVRGAARSRDIATRIALGASRRQLVAEQLGESLTLAVIGSLIGLSIAYVAVAAFGAATSDIIEAFWVDFRVDRYVVLFASALAALAAAAAGLGPALRVSSANAIEVLKDRSQGSTGMRLGRVTRRLPAAQIAMACGLLALTMVLGRAAVELRTKPWPFDASRILSAQYGLTLETLNDVERRNRVLSELARGIEQQPGVEAAGLASVLPGKGGGEWGISLDQPHDTSRPAPHTTAVASVTPGFFGVVGGRMLAGRGLTSRDDASAPAVAVVNESFVRRFSANRDPVGRRVFLGRRELTIVGVVQDLMARDLQESRGDGLYASIFQVRPFAVRVVMRGAGDPLDLVATLRRETARVDPDLPLFETFTLREAALRDKAVLDVLSSLFLLFGTGALVLTAIGLYGVVSFAVSQRTREFGIRLALGASRRDIAAMVASQGGRQIAVGLGIGIAIGVGLTRAFAAAIEGAPAGDAQVLGVIVAAVSTTAVAAMTVPTWRAASTGVISALRHE